MNIERDKFLTEIMDDCWHKPMMNDYRGPYPHFSCSKCKKLKSITIYFTEIDNAERLINLSFSTPDGFFKLWNWAKEQDWWDSFSDPNYGVGGFYDLSIIHPDRFANVIYEFLWRK